MNRELAFNLQPATFNFQLLRSGVARLRWTARSSSAIGNNVAGSGTTTQVRNPLSQLSRTIHSA